MRHKRTTELRYPSLSRGVIGEWCPSLTGPTGSTLRDLSPCRNHGTLTNMDAASDWVPSQGRYALDLDGVNDCVLFGSPPSLSGAIPELTKSMWVLMRSASFEYIFADFNNAGSVSRLSLYVDTQFAAFQNTSTIITGTTTIVLNRWYHVAVTRSDSAGLMRLYLDGRQEASVSYAYTSPALQSSGEQIGRSNATFGDYANMLWDDARIYNRVVTASEVQLLARRRGIAYETVRRHRARRRILRSRQYQQPIGVGIY